MTQPTTLRVVREITPTLFVVEVNHQGVAREVRMSRHEYLMHSTLYVAIEEITAGRRAREDRKKSIRGLKKLHQVDKCGTMLYK